MSTKYKIVTPPAVDPVTLAEAKTHARIYVSDDDAEDAYITSLIKASTEKLEASTCRSFITRTVQASFGEFPHDGSSGSRFNTFRSGRPNQARLDLWYPPGQAITSITYADADGVVQTMDPADYVFDGGTPCSISPAPGKSWPTGSSVKVTFTAGFGDDPADVPEVAKLVIKVMVALFYDRREPIITGTIVNAIPFMLDPLAATLRWGEYP